MTDDSTKRVKIPSDAQVVREFLAEAEAFKARTNDPDNDSTDPYLHGEWVGNMEARNALASRLQYVRAQRAQLAQESAEKLAEGIREAGRRLASLADSFAKAEGKADGS